MNIKLALKILITTAAILIILGYAYFETKDFARGPVITISEPANGSTIQNSPVNISGYAKNISYISLNDRQIFTDKAGFFNEKLLLYPGYNIISIKAKDRFKRSVESDLEVIYLNPNLINTNLKSQAPNSASSTNTQVNE
jgi:hypothetical protein